MVRCNGSCENRPRTAQYDGARSCAIAHATSGGETGCTFGCLGCGDCVEVCQFDAIHMNPETGLPEVDEEKCTACGACSKACPRKIIEIRPKGKNNRRDIGLGHKPRIGMRNGNVCRRHGKTRGIGILARALNVHDPN